MAATGRVLFEKRSAAAPADSGECKTITEAAEAVGMARESLSRALSRPHVAEHLRQRVLRLVAVEDQRRVCAGAETIRATERFQWILCPALLGVMQSKHRDAMLRCPML